MGFVTRFYEFRAKGEVIPGCGEGFDKGLGEQATGEKEGLVTVEIRVFLRGSYCGSGSAVAWGRGWREDKRAGWVCFRGSGGSGLVATGYAVTMSLQRSRMESPLSLLSFEFAIHIDKPREKSHSKYFF